MRPSGTLSSILVVLAALLTGLDAGAATRTRAVDPQRVCAEAVSTRERAAGIPQFLLSAISFVESGRWDETQQRTVAWPWAVMAEGEGKYFPTKQEAIAAVEDLQTRGVRNIDVGCMQVNLKYHPDAFASLDEAFDPHANAAYAARFLRRLFEETGSWLLAAGRYHSATPELGEPYRMKVLQRWNRQLVEAFGPKAAIAPDIMLASIDTKVPKVIPTAPNWRVRSVRFATPAGQRSALALTPRARLAAARVGTMAPETQDLYGRVETGMRDARAEATFASRRVAMLRDWRDTRSGFATMPSIVAVPTYR